MRHDDLAREVYGILGIPLDIVDMGTALHRIRSAVATRTPFLVSTANLNFLITSQFDTEFRMSLLHSDLCTADGMPIVWVARLLGIPIRERVAGADIFAALKTTIAPTNRLKVFFFGGAEHVAATACKNVNSESCGVSCVGSFYPGFTPVDDMSLDAVIEKVNSSRADFLAVALGAVKGQAWLLRNHDRIQIPVRAHLGAAINFEAGSVRRAPSGMQKSGFEWLWRIKEEPQLWRRYRADGLVFLHLILTRVVPLKLISLWSRVDSLWRPHGLAIARTDDQNAVILNLNGVATADNIAQLVSGFQEAVAASKDIVINFRDTRLIDARFVGLLCMLKKHIGRRRLRLSLTDVPRRIERIFRLNGFQFLLR